MDAQTHSVHSLSRCRLEQFDRITVRVLHLDLFPTRSDFHLVSKTSATLLERGDARWQILHVEDDAIPSARLLRPTIRHGSRTRSARSTENQLEVLDGHLTEGRQILVIELEAERGGVELD